MTRRPAAALRRGTITDRVFAALPLAGIVLGVLVFYGTCAWMRKSPWVFTDELEWTQLSRSIAETGEASRRGEPIFFQSLYAYLIAPAWWLPSTSTAYSAVKYANTVVMLLAALPAYLLARMLVSRPAAYAVAALTVAVPAMSYATSIVPESLAYTWFALCAWLGVRALALRTPASIAAALAVSALAPLVRSKLAVIPISFLAAALVLAIADGRLSVRRAWRARDLVVGAVVVAGGAILLEWVLLSRLQSWEDVHAYLNADTLSLGRLAGGAFAIGIGVLPAIGGLASLRVRERLRDPAYRAFASYLGVSLVAFAVYTGSKAAFLSKTLGTLIEERNLFYLTPLMLVGTAIVLEARRLDWRVVGAATAFVLLLLWGNGYIVGQPYFEAPGLSVVTLVNRGWHWGIGEVHWALTATAAVAVCLLVLRRRRAVPLVAAALVLAWMLTGQIAATAGNNKAANREHRMVPAPADWIDRATGGQKVTWLGQLVVEPRVLWLTEFWNRSIANVTSLDATAPGPGPESAPNVISADGTLSQPTGDAYVLAANGVSLQGELVARRGDQKLYRIRGPWRLNDAVWRIYPDGWASDSAAYTYFRRRGPGIVEVDLSRTGYNGDAAPAHAVVRVGTVRIDPRQHQPRIGRLLAERRVLVRNNEARKVRVRVGQTPVQVEVGIGPTFVASPGDPRQLGAQVAFRFLPDRGS